MSLSGKCVSPSLITVSSHVQSIQGADHHIKIIHIQFQYNESIAIYRFDSPSQAEIVVFFISLSFSRILPIVKHIYQKILFISGRLIHTKQRFRLS